MEETDKNTEESKGQMYATSRLAFMGNYFIIVLLVIFLALVWIQFKLTFTLFPKTIADMTSSLIILGFLLLISVLVEEPVWRRILHHYIVTDKEIIYQSGWMSKKQFTLPYQSIADVRIEKGIIGRIFDYGDIIIDGFKEGMELRGIRHAEALYEKLRVKIRPNKSIYKRGPEEK